MFAVANKTYIYAVFEKDISHYSYWRTACIRNKF